MCLIMVIKTLKDKLEKIPLYQIMSAAQLNEAEYAGPLSAALLFCHATNVQVPIAAALAVFGQVGYYWPRVVRRGADSYRVWSTYRVSSALTHAPPSRCSSAASQSYDEVRRQ